MLNNNRGLIELREAFEKGQIDKLPYYFAMQARHAILSEYAEFLKETNIGSITLKPAQVLFTTADHGVVFECDPEDRGVPPIVSINQRSYEPEELQMVLGLVDGCKEVYDVGANIGWYALHIAKRFPQCRVVAFEPIKKTRSFLKKNVEHNKLANVTVLPIGLHSQEDTLTFHVDTHIMGAASSSPDRSTGPIAEPCRVRRLDDVALEWKSSVNFLKIDTEGAEWFVLQGGKRILSEDRPIIFAELLRKHAKKFGYHPNDILAWMAELGYRTFIGKHGRLIPFKVMTEETKETNFFFLHQQCHSDRIARYA
jgi:FkbM family methyltransferase